MTTNVQPTVQYQWLKKMSFWLVLLLTCLPQFTAGFRVNHETLGSSWYSGGNINCTSNWCGEQWRAQRILYYNLTAYSKLVITNRTTLSTEHDCEGAVTSANCERTGSDTTSHLTTTREVEIERSNPDNPIVVRDSPELDHYLILSDNVELVEGGPKQISPNYPANLTKIWQYKIPKGCKMHVRFLNFSIENTRGCKKDYFSVQTSKNKDEVRVYCDRLEWIEIKYRRRAQFTLYSDNAVNNGQVAAKVCISKKDSDSLNCDCENQVERRRRRRDSDNTLDHQSSNEAVNQNQRLSALQRLKNARLIRQH